MVQDFLQSDEWQKVEAEERNGGVADPRYRLFKIEEYDEAPDDSKRGVTLIEGGGNG